MRECHKDISGWGQYPMVSCKLLRPERYHEIDYFDTPLIARGMGRSYGDAAINSNGHVLLMERLKRFLSFDAHAGIVRAEAGVTLKEIVDVFLPRGWMIPVTSGTKHVTLGGCIAADVHGKNHHVDGTFGKFVRALELSLPDGSKRRCSPKQDAELFWATVGGMGLTGVITEVTLQLKPVESAYMNVKHYEANHLDAVLELLSNSHLDDHYSVAWIDCLAHGKKLGRGIVMNAHHITLQEVPKSIADPFHVPKKFEYPIPFNVPSWLLRPQCVRFFNSIYYKLQKQRQDFFITDCDAYFYPLDRIRNWNRLYGKKGLVQYQCVLPDSSAREGLKVILEHLSKENCPSFLAVLKRFGGEGKGYLSFPMSGFTLSLDIPNVNKELLLILDTLDKEVLRFGGRLYLAKDSRMTPEAFRSMYTRFPQWLEIKNRVDPKGLISSDLSRRLKMEQL